MKPIPTLKELYDNLYADLKNKLGLSDSQLKVAANAMASVLSAQLKLVYAYITDVQRNVFPDTADTADDGGELNRMGQLYLKRQPFPATDGIYALAITGVDGSVLSAGLTFKSNDDSRSPGYLYQLEDEYILSGTSGTVQVRSLNPGKDYELLIGDKVTATEPIIGVQQEAAVIGIITPPTAAEDTERYRQSILDALILEPQGGAFADYRIWAADATGVQRVYPYLKNGDAGTVQVYVEATPVDSTDSKGTPSQGILDQVAEVIEMDPDETRPLNERGRRPGQAFVEVLPVNVVPVDVQISGLTVDTSSIRAQISEALNEALFDVRPYIGGVDLQRDKNDVLTSVRAQSVVTDALGTANTFTGFKLYVEGIEVSTYTFSGGNIPYLRNVNYL